MRSTWMVYMAPLLILLGACGQDYEPPEPETSGQEAAAIGQVLDLEVVLPHLVYPGSGTLTTRLSVSIELPLAGEGSAEGQVEYERASVGGAAATLHDLSTGKATITRAGDLWRSGRIGPIEVDGVSFEYMLRGSVQRRGWRLVGTSWESQSGGEGSFLGWRRDRFLVVGTDYLASGRVELVELVRGQEIRVQHDLARTSPDPQLRVSGGAVLVINRLSYDNIQRLDPKASFLTSWQARVGAGSNPHDAWLVSPDKIYVSRYEPPFNDLAIRDARNGEALGTISLAHLAENPDGYPRADQLAQAGGLVFTGLQDIDRSFSRYAEAKLAVIDVATDELVSSLPLPGKNPGVLVVVEEEGRQKLYVTLAGIFPGILGQELSGGVAVVDIPNRAFERWALDDDDAGGNLSGLAVASPRLAYAIVTDERFVNRVRVFDPQAGVLRRTLLETTNFVPQIVLGGGGVLAVPDRDWARPGLCLYRVPEDPRGSEVLIGCAELELPPATLASLDP